MTNKSAVADDEYHEVLQSHRPLTLDLARRVVEFISAIDPFGDDFCQNDLRAIENAGRWTEAACCRGLAPRSECLCHQQEDDSSESN